MRSPFRSSWRPGSHCPAAMVRARSGRRDFRTVSPSSIPAPAANSLRGSSAFTPRPARAISPSPGLSKQSRHSVTALSRCASPATWSSARSGWCTAACALKPTAIGSKSSGRRRSSVSASCLPHLCLGCLAPARSPFLPQKRQLIRQCIGFHGAGLFPGLRGARLFLARKYASRRALPTKPSPVKKAPANDLLTAIETSLVTRIANRNLQLVNAQDTRPIALHKLSDLKRGGSRIASFAPERIPVDRESINLGRSRLRSRYAASSIHHPHRCPARR
jgi:hypothetical protein